MTDSSKSSRAILASLEETYKKVTSSLIPSIEEHVTSKDYSAETDSLDFLSAKNSLMLSYLIDLVQLVRLVEKKKLRMSRGDDEDGAEAATVSMKACLSRLNEMKVALDKVRPVEKRMRYQIDRLLAAAGDATSFAAGADAEDDEEGEDGIDNEPAAATAQDNADPLSFRPNLEMMGSDNDDNNSNGGMEGDGSSDEDVDSGSDNDDEDLRAAKAAVARAGPSSRSRGKKRYGGGDSDDDGDGGGRADAIYQAPRFAAVPFAEREKAEEKAERVLARQRRRMRQSELLQTLRAADGTDRPEEDDLDGGAALGKQKEAARKMAERSAEKTKFEEDMMVRLTESRRDKKARARMLREEQSNLGAISDLGRLAAGVADAFGGEDDAGASDDNFGTGGSVGFMSGDSEGRHNNGKRRRGGDDYAESHGERKRKKSGVRGSNAMQRALYGTEGKHEQKKKRSKR
mmetsp:Transcript_16138/g.35074  ORF Transcript_16138/g.35074 Transcript_16138/m.35074 type:complete len:459 (+) Transcript_16138:137-1513(+)